MKECPGCAESRYKLKDNYAEDDDSVTRKGVPDKVVWYLRIIQRFKRPFTNVNDATNTIWHTYERLCDDKRFHVENSLQWEKID